jgi:hypothetical protein
LTSHARYASRTTPTLWVLVIRTGPSRKPDSSSQWVPVMSPLPFWEKKPPKTGSEVPLPRGQTAVTPVRTDEPSIRVVWPTSTPWTSVMAFIGPVVPSKGTPRSRARGLVWAARARAAASRRARNLMASKLR